MRLRSSNAAWCRATVAGWAPGAILVAAAALLLQACGPSWSPVEESSTRPGPYRSGDFALTPEGRYRVRRGDSLHVIAFNFGLDWRDLARWNQIDPPYTIYPDQELRLAPRQATSPAVVTRPAPSPGAAVSREGPSVTTPASDPVAPVVLPQALPQPGPDSTAQVDPAPESSPHTAGSGDGEADAEPGSSGAPQTKTARAASPSPPPASPAPAPNVAAPLRDPDRWLWPADGRVVGSFRSNDPARNGIDIAGQDGQPVRASAAGEVVYSGNGLIGYGELIIVKHSDRMLSAYAHNRQRLVHEGQRVAAGEQIAEMGRNDRSQAILHFEIRIDGTPQDPLKYLPRP